MARTRNLKPGFFKNEDLADLPPLVRLLFAGLWCLADRDGRLEDRPRRLKAEILPFDDGDPDQMLDALANSPGKFIVRYVSDGKRFIAIPQFNRHQNPHVAEKAAGFPPPPGVESEERPERQEQSLQNPSTDTAPDKHSASMMQAPDANDTASIAALNENGSGRALNLKPSSCHLPPFSSHEVLVDETIRDDHLCSWSKEKEKDVLSFCDRKFSPQTDPVFPRWRRMKPEDRELLLKVGALHIAGQIPELWIDSALQAIIHHGEQSATRSKPIGNRIAYFQTVLADTAQANLVRIPVLLAAVTVPVYLLRQSRPDRSSSPRPSAENPSARVFSPTEPLPTGSGREILQAAGLVGIQKAGMS